MSAPFMCRLGDEESGLHLSALGKPPAPALSRSVVSPAARSVADTETAGPRSTILCFTPRGVTSAAEGYLLSPAWGLCVVHTRGLHRDQTSQSRTKPRAIFHTGKQNYYFVYMLNK